MIPIRPSAKPGSICSPGCATRSIASPISRGSRADVDQNVLAGSRRDELPAESAVDDPLRLPLRRRRLGRRGRATRNLLGGKGANLAEMASIGLPVPPGFTISTATCALYYDEGRGLPRCAARRGGGRASPISKQVTGKSFGDAADPLLVSVRSGARVSMPGMMDTVLNLGLNDETVRGLAAASGDPRFAWDSYRRFIQMYSDVVLGLDHGAFEEALEIAKEDKGVHLDTDLEAGGLGAARRPLQGSGRGASGRGLSRRTSHEQLWGAIGAVFGSWQSERAKTYRRLNAHPRRLGHGGQRPGDGVRQYGRDVARPASPSPAIPSTGERGLLWRISDQRPGRGRRRRHPHPAISDPRRAREGRRQGAVDGRDDAGGVTAELARVFDLLERHYRDMQDIEFTVERGTLWMLQTRSGKRTAKAALRIAVDMAERGADHARRRRCCASIRRRSTSCSTRRSIRPPSAR